MKVPNSTIDAILDGSMRSIDPTAAVALIKALAEDLKEARENKRQVVRFPIPVIAAGVSHAIRVETPGQLRMNVPEPYASWVEARARTVARHVDGAAAFPMYLVPRTGLWILNLHNVATGTTAAVCRAARMEELAELLARERAPGQLPGSNGPFRPGGPLEQFASPSSVDCFVNVLESTDTYIAHAIAGLKEAKDL